MDFLFRIFATESINVDFLKRILELELVLEFKKNEKKSFLKFKQIVNKKEPHPILWDMSLLNVKWKYYQGEEA